MRRLGLRGLQLGLLGAVLMHLAVTPCSGSVRVESVSFPTNVVEDTTNDHPVDLKAKLFLPEHTRRPLPAVVITPSSGGIDEVREIHYAKALSQSGIAALVIDSFGSRGVTDSIYDQRLVETWDSENDAMAGLLWLLEDDRFDADRIGVLGVSKGGSAALDTALDIRREWMGIDDVSFAAHIAISPDCTWINRSTRTSGAPIFFMLAERDDQTPADACIDYADRLRKGGNSAIKVKVYEDAHHAWEEIGDEPEFDASVENYRNCRVWVEDDGSMVSADTGRRIPERSWHRWAKRNCMKLGAHCCGGTEELREEATRDIINFLRQSGF